MVWRFKKKAKDIKNENFVALFKLSVALMSDGPVAVKYIVDII